MQKRRKQKAEGRIEVRFFRLVGVAFVFNGFSSVLLSALASDERLQHDEKLGAQRAPSFTAIMVG